MTMYKERYGDTIDGNRGIPIKYYELDSTDEPEIQSQIIEYIQATNELPEDPFFVHLIAYDTQNDIEFEVNPFEHLTEAECTSYLTNMDLACD